MNEIDDSALLSATSSHDTLEALYRIARLLQINPRDTRALGNIHSLDLHKLRPDEAEPDSPNLLHELLVDPDARYPDAGHLLRSSP